MKYCKIVVQKKDYKNKKGDNETGDKKERKRLGNKLQEKLKSSGLEYWMRSLCNH